MGSRVPKTQDVGVRPHNGSATDSVSVTLLRGEEGCI